MKDSEVKVKGLPHCVGCAALIPENEKLKQEVRSQENIIKIEYELRQEDRQEIRRLGERFTAFQKLMADRLGELIEAREKIVELQERLLGAKKVVQ